MYSYLLMATSCAEVIIIYIYIYYAVQQATNKSSLPLLYFSSVSTVSYTSSFLASIGSTASPPSSSVSVSSFSSSFSMSTISSYSIIYSSGSNNDSTSDISSSLLSLMIAGSSSTSNRIPSFWFSLIYSPSSYKIACYSSSSILGTHGSHSNMVFSYFLTGCTSVSSNFSTLLITSSSTGNSFHLYMCIRLPVYSDMKYFPPW